MISLAIAVWQKVNTGSHSPCAFDLLRSNSVFLDVLAWGKVKREGRGKKAEKGVEKQRGRNRNRQTCKFEGKGKKQCRYKCRQRDREKRKTIKAN